MKAVQILEIHCEPELQREICKVHSEEIETANNDRAPDWLMEMIDNAWREGLAEA
jgi:hypothetical protein